jgi:phage tail-like protein
MADAALDVQFPFVAFNFGVEITLAGSSKPLCGASFAECDGLEMTLDVKTLREGGNNTQQYRLSGPVSFGQLVLKRGMTQDSDLWDWFRKVTETPSLHATAEVVLFSSEAGKFDARARFSLTGCVPVKLKAPPFNAKEGLLAIEELQIAYETLTFSKPKTNGGG